MHGDTILGIQWGMQYSPVNIVWDTASTGSYGGTVFPGGYVIHWDTGFTLTPGVCLL